MNIMVFCSRCGKELLEDAFFCSKCGTRTKKGIEAGVASPLEEIRTAFRDAGKEMEKAFQRAAKEMEAAFKSARENIRESVDRERTCPHCKTKNQANATFCYNCGKKLS